MLDWFLLLDNECLTGFYHCGLSVCDWFLSLDCQYVTGFCGCGQSVPDWFLSLWPVSTRLVSMAVASKQPVGMRSNS